MGSLLIKMPFASKNPNITFEFIVPIRKTYSLIFHHKIEKAEQAYLLSYVISSALRSIIWC